MTEVRYRGDVLVDPNGFLCELPRGVDRKISYWLAAITHAADSIHLAWNELSSATAEAAGADPTRVQRAAMFNAAWSIVDSLHMARRALIGLTKNQNGIPSELEKFITIGSDATKLRNGMDHVSEAVGNHAKKKGPQPALFGVLGYVYRPPDEPNRPYTMFERAGPPLGESTKLDFIEPEDNFDGAPITGQFRLSAFGDSIDFAGAIACFGDMLSKLEEVLQDGFLRELENSGFSEEQRIELATPHPPQLTVAIRESLREDEDVSLR